MLLDEGIEIITIMKVIMPREISPVFFFDMGIITYDFIVSKWQ